MTHKLSTDLKISEYEAYYYVKDGEAEKELVKSLHRYGVAVFFPDYKKTRTYPAIVGKRPVQITTGGTYSHLVHFTTTEYCELWIDVSKRLSAAMNELSSLKVKDAT